MSEDLKFKLRSMSLGVLPSDAKSQNIDLSAMEASASVRRHPTIACDAPEDGASSSTTTFETKHDRRKQSGMSVTFEDGLPGTPLAANGDAQSPTRTNSLKNSSNTTHACESPADVSAQDNAEPSAEISAPDPAANTQPLRRASNREAQSSASLSPSSSSDAAQGQLQRSKTFKLKFSAPKRSDSTTPRRPSTRGIGASSLAAAAAKEPVEHQHEPARASRRFSIVCDFPPAYQFLSYRNTIHH
jgi:hypothetical protein